MSSADARTILLSAALAHLDAGAAEPPSARQLCAESGVSNGSFYHHFGSGSGFVAALVDHTLAGYRAVLSEALAAAEGAPALVSALVHHHLAWVSAHPNRARFLARARPTLDADHDRHTRQLTQAFLAALRARLEAAGVQPAVPWVLAQPLVIGPADALCRQWLAGRLPAGLMLADHAPDLAAAALRALGLQPVAAPLAAASAAAAQPLGADQVALSHARQADSTSGPRAASSP